VIPLGEKITGLESALEEKEAILSHIMQKKAHSKRRSPGLFFLRGV